MLAGSRPLVEEPRTTRRIRKAMVRTFQDQGFNVRPDMVAIYWGRSQVRVHIAILESCLEVQHHARTITGLQFADGMDFAEVQ